MLTNLRLKVLLEVVAVFAISWVVVAAPPESKSAVSPLPASAPELRQRIETTLEQRDAALAQLGEQVKSAPTAERDGLQIEYARLAEEYEIQLLTLQVEYHHLTGNLVEQQRAETLLQALKNGPSSENQKSVKSADPAPQANAKEGVITDAK